MEKFRIFVLAFYIFKNSFPCLLSSSSFSVTPSSPREGLAVPDLSVEIRTLLSSYYNERCAFCYCTALPLLLTFFTLDFTSMIDVLMAHYTQNPLLLCSPDTHNHLLMAQQGLNCNSNIFHKIIEYYGETRTEKNFFEKIELQIHL